MILIDLPFIESFSPNEQLIMIYLLLHADDNGVVEFSDRYISRETGITYQKVRTIHQKWLVNNFIANAPTNADSNAPTNATPHLVTISNYEHYSQFNINYNAPTNAPTNAGDNAQKEEINKEKEKVFPQTPLQIQKEKNKEEKQPPIVPQNVDEENKRLNDELEQVKKMIADLSEENKKLRDENAKLTKLNNKKYKPEKFDVWEDLSYVDENHYAMWYEWLQYKGEIKKQYNTQAGVKKAYTHWINLSNGDLEKASAIIDQSIMRNWDGLFDVRDYRPKDEESPQTDNSQQQDNWQY